MKIGFDVSQTGADKAGCGFVAYNLIRALPELMPDDQFLLYPTFGDLYWDPQWDQGTYATRRPNVVRGYSHAQQDQTRSFWRQPPADLEAVLGEPDLIHSHNFFCPKGLRRTRLVYTLYDLNFLENPDWTTEENRIGCFSGVFQAALYADMVIAISDFSRQHFLATFPHYPADRTATVHLASRFSAIHATIRSARLEALTPRMFWLAVGTIEPRKNYEGLIRAYATLKAQRSASPGTPPLAPLVIAGKLGWMMPHFPALIAELGLTQDVVMLGYVSEDELCWLYRHCFAMVYPTFWEGFGLPVIEALSLGAPVISSRVSSIPEILDGVGLMVDPGDTDGLVRAMAELLDTPGLRDSLSHLGLERAQEFSWDSGARQVSELYREVTSRPKFAGLAP